MALLSFKILKIIEDFKIFLTFCLCSPAGTGRLWWRTRTSRYCRPRPWPASEGIYEYLSEKIIYIQLYLYFIFWECYHWRSLTNWPGRRWRVCPGWGLLLAERWPLSALSWRCPWMWAHSSRLSESSAQKDHWQWPKWHLCDMDSDKVTTVWHGQCKKWRLFDMDIGKSDVCVTMWHGQWQKWPHYLAGLQEDWLGLRAVSHHGRGDVQDRHQELSKYLVPTIYRKCLTLQEAVSLVILLTASNLTSKSPGPW